MTTSFNATKDMIGHYVLEAIDSNGTIDILLLSSAEADGAMANRATVEDLLVGSTEATFSNYTRKTLASPTRTVDDENDQVLLGGAPVGTSVQITWEDAGGTTNNTLTKVVFFYNPSDALGDADRLPLMATDIAASTDGNDLVLTLHEDGFARVRNP